MQQPPRSVKGELHTDEHDPQAPELHGRLRPGRRRAPGALPAAAFPPGQLMLGHLGAHRRRVEDLAALHPGHRPARQPGVAPAAAARLRADLPVRPATCASVNPLCPSCPRGLRPVFFRSDLGAGLPRPSPNGGCEESRGFCRSRASSSAIRSRARASSASSPRSDMTGAASTSGDGGSCSAGTPTYRPDHPLSRPESLARARPLPAGSLPAPARPGHDQQTVTASLPLLLLDVDGVLNPFAAAACPPGYTEHDFFPGEEPVRLCPAHGSWLQELAARFQIVWATAWGADANRLLAPRLRLPELPVIAFPPVPFHPRDKLPAIIRYAGHRPLAWIDDAIPPETHAWAASRRVPTLLISIDPAEGLTRPAVDQALRWAERQAAG